MLGILNVVFDKRSESVLVKKNYLLSCILKAYNKQHPHTKFATDVSLSLLRESYPTKELVSATPNQDIGNKLKAVFLWFLHLNYHYEE